MQGFGVRWIRSETGSGGGITTDRPRHSSRAKRGEVTNGFESQEAEIEQIVLQLIKYASGPQYHRV